MNRIQNENALATVASNGSLEEFDTLFSTASNVDRQLAFGRIGVVTENVMHDDDKVVEKIRLAVQTADFKPEDSALLSLARATIKSRRPRSLNEILKIMKERDVELINFDDPKESTLLILACDARYMSGNELMVGQIGSILLKAGAKPEADSMCRHPLSILQEREMGHTVLAQLMQAYLDAQKEVLKLTAMQEQLAQHFSPDQVALILAGTAATAPATPRALPRARP